MECCSLGYCYHCLTISVATTTEIHTICGLSYCTYYSKSIYNLTFFFVIFSSGLLLCFGGNFLCIFLFFNLRFILYLSISTQFFFFTTCKFVKKKNEIRWLCIKIPLRKEKCIYFVGGGKVYAKRVENFLSYYNSIVMS